MTGTLTFQNIDLSSWITLYISTCKSSEQGRTHRRASRSAVAAPQRAWISV